MADVTNHTKITYYGGPIGLYEPPAVAQFLERLRAIGLDPRVIEHPCWPLVTVIPGGPESIPPLESLVVTRQATEAEVVKWLHASTFKERLEVTVRGTPMALGVLQFMVMELGLDSIRGRDDEMTYSILPGRERHILEVMEAIRVEVVSKQVVLAEATHEAAASV